MKAFLSLCVIFCLFGVASSCNRDNALLRKNQNQYWFESNGKIKVLCTTEMILAVVKAVGGESIDAIALIKGGIDPHSYQIIKGDEEKFSRAAVIFYNGLGLEHRPSLAYQLQKHPHSIALGDEVLKHFPSSTIRVDHEIDPHLWMDVSLWSKTIPIVIDALGRLNPLQKQEFETRGNHLQRQMLETHERIKTSVQHIPQDKRYLVTTHDAFNYFARAYLANLPDFENDNWRYRVAAPEGLSPESQLGACHLRIILDYIKNHSIHVVFPENAVSKDSLKKIVDVANEKGLNVVLSKYSLYSDSLISNEDPTQAYLETMRYNADVFTNEIMMIKEIQ